MEKRHEKRDISFKIIIHFAPLSYYNNYLFTFVENRMIPLKRKNKWMNSKTIVRVVSACAKKVGKKRELEEYFMKNKHELVMLNI